VAVLQSLHHLNLRENKIAKFENLKFLIDIPSLKSLTVLQNPMSEEGGAEAKKVFILRYF